MNTHTILGAAYALLISASLWLPAQANATESRTERSLTPKVQKVSFPNNTVTVVGNLFVPSNLNESRKHPAIIVAHPWGGVKEQTAGLYARRLAEQGFIALAYDASHYGESGGEPRYLENPFDRVEDIRSAADFLANHPLVDESRIGILGICAGGGYAISAAQTDLRLKAVAAISAYDVGAASREGLGTIAPISTEDRVKILRELAEQRTREARGDPARVDQLMPAAAPVPAAATFFREAYDYYATARGQHPNSSGNFRFTSNAFMMAFYPFAAIETISPRPLLLIAGSEAESLYFSQRADQQAQGPKELVIIPDATHFDLYDKPQYVTPIVTKLTAFFMHNL